VEEPSRSGETEQAEQAERLERLEEQSLDALYRRGLRAQRRGDVPGAERHYQAILRRAPYHFLTRLQLGRLSLAGDPRGARDHLRIALQVHPSSDEAHYALGQALEALGQELEAAEAYRQTIHLNPRHYDANARLRRILRELREGRSVVERAAEAFNANPSLATLTLLGRIVMENTPPRQAVLEFEEVRRHQPELAEVELWLARAKAAIGDGTGEVEAYQRYLARNPAALGVRLLLVERLVGQGWFQNASELLRPVWDGGRTAPNDVPPETRARITFLRSRLLSAQQRPGAAGEMLLQADDQGYDPGAIAAGFGEDLALYPEEAALWYAFGIWHRHRGRPALAADALAEAGRRNGTQRHKALAILRLMEARGEAPAAVALARAELARAAGELAGALALLETIPPGHPLDHRAALLRGMIHRERGELDAALDAFTRYVFSFPEWRNVLYARGNLFWELGRHREALAVWMEDPGVLAHRPGLLSKAAAYYRERGETAQETALRERLAEALPVDQGNRIRLGELYEQQGRTLEAVFLWERVLSDRSRDPDLLRRVGMAWIGLHDRSRAIPYLQRASQLKPLDAGAAELLARELFAARQYEEALRVYWGLYRQRPDHPDLPRVLPVLVLNVPAEPGQRRAAARLARETGALELASEVLEGLVSDQPGDRAGRIELAELYLLQDRPERAEQVLFPPGVSPEEHPEGLALLARAQERLGRGEALADTLGLLYRLRPEDAGLARRRGLLLASLRRPEEARPLLAQALAAQPEDARVELALADVALALGDPAEAERRLSGLLTREQDHAVAQKRLIDLLLSRQRWDEAVPLLERWVAGHPRDETPRYNLVVAYLKGFQTEAARPHYEVLRQLNPRRAEGLATYFR
jgi:tetratricopeptide (TPR) repeat protein